MCDHEYLCEGFDPPWYLPDPETGIHTRREGTIFFRCRLCAEPFVFHPPKVWPTGSTVFKITEPSEEDLINEIWK